MGGHGAPPRMDGCIKTSSWPWIEWFGRTFHSKGHLLNIQSHKGSLSVTQNSGIPRVQSGSFKKPTSREGSTATRDFNVDFQQFYLLEWTMAAPTAASASGV